MVAGSSHNRAPAHGVPGGEVQVTQWGWDTVPGLEVRVTQWGWDTVPGLEVRVTQWNWDIVFQSERLGLYTMRLGHCSRVRGQGYTVRLGHCVPGWEVRATVRLGHCVSALEVRVTVRLGHSFRVRGSGYTVRFGYCVSGWEVQVTQWDRDTVLQGERLGLHSEIGTLQARYTVGWSECSKGMSSVCVELFLGCENENHCTSMVLLWSLSGAGWLRLSLCVCIVMMSLCLSCIDHLRFVNSDFCR